MQLRDLTNENTREYIGHTFRISFTDGNVVELRLERVDLLMEKHVSPKMKRDAFALIFRGPANLVLRQHMYPLQHETLGVLPVFLVPIALEEAGAVYEAVFN